MRSINPDAQEILIWLMKGTEPTDRAFDNQHRGRWKRPPSMPPRSPRIMT